MDPMIAVVMGLTFVAGAWPAGQSRPDFDKTVAPLFIQRCLDCHSGPKPKGGLDLSQREKAMAGGKSGSVLTPGKSDDSLLWEYVKNDKMPPKKPLAAAEKSLLKQWIVSGAHWGADPIDPFRTSTDKRAGYDWWALQPVVRPRLPPVQRTDWIRTPIDAFVLNRLQTGGLSPSAPADRRTLIRRLSFDLLGLPPSPEDVAAFVNDDTPDAYERLVERYMNSPQFGVRWARHWLDVVRFGESNGFEFDEFRANAWPYRDWVIDAFNQDLPYDEFVRLQIAGDVFRPTDPEAVKATGFLVAGAYDFVGQTQQSDAMRRVVRQDELEDMAGTLGQTFLGLTVHCARCHDHKFDPVRQVEYYRLTAALDGVRHGERDLALLDPSVTRARQRVVELIRQAAALEVPVRQRILVERLLWPQPGPKAVACWNFQGHCKDGLGALHGTVHGDARLVAGGLKLDGKTGFVATTPLAGDLRAKTLEAWVTLDNLAQRGGAVLSVHTRVGGQFDALVFGELESRQWMAGSENFVRTQSFRAQPESEAHQRTIHLALVYAEDGTITAYRNGRPYGLPYKSAGIHLFQAGQTEILFGLRHRPAGGNRMLSGTIHRARLYDRALTPAEVATSAETFPTVVLTPTLVAHMSPEERSRWVQVQTELRRQRALAFPQPRLTYAVVPRQPEPAHLLIRGNPEQPGAVVAAGGVEAFTGVRADFDLRPDAPEGERRKRLAAWITDPKNPLFARVMVNRLWQHHFGVGLVETPNDFGFNGGRPSHPELLDWLAAELIERNWSLKQIHRTIVLSSAYRQSSRLEPTAMRVDAGNRLLWRRSPQRLEAETVRDALLSVAGKLNPKLGGPGFEEFRRFQARGTPANLYQPVEPIGNESNRRTLYRTWARGGRNRFLDAFDCPDPSTTAPSRAVTTTPLQALSMMNHALVLRMADRFAERLRREAGEDFDRQIERAYLLAYGRQPDDDERRLARRAVQAYGPAVLARAIFNSNEFLYID
jgi:hypothetical protein